MKKKYMMLFVFVFGLLSFLVAGCIEDPTESVYDPNDKGKRPTPVISSITPQNVAYAVLDEIVIRGENFSTVIDDNIVYFGTTIIDVESATPTELRFQTPNIPGNVNIKIAVMGAQLFSNVINYNILPAFIEMGNYTAADAFYAIESDAAGNIYVNIVTGSTGRIEKMDSEGNKEEYGTIPFTSANSMRFGPDGSLYITRSNRAISRIPPGGGAAVTYANMASAQETAYDIDFDNYGNMWVVCNNVVAANRRVVRINTLNQDDTGTIVRSYPFNAQLRAVKVFNDYLYVAGGDGNDNNRVKIWRALITSSGELGTFELYFNWAANYTYAINAITFAQDGTLYAGTGGPDDETIIAISPSKVAAPLYPGFMKRNTYNLIWGTGSNSQYIFVSRRINATGGHADNRIMKIYMAKDGAPYFGRK
jgi:hypothetical protein